jgi:hypothetical protein
MNGNQLVKKPHGKIRRSQVITTFGPGAMLDLPRYAVLVAGLDTWSFAGDEEIREPRLVEKLKVILGVNHLQLRYPPANLDDPTLPKTGIGAWQFPEWFITEVVPLPGQPANVRSRMLVHRKQLQGKTNVEYKDGPKAKKLSVVPIRFVRACRNGHIGDIDWRFFVHHGYADCKRQLWIDETGTSADLSELFVRCECGNATSRCMSDAAAKDMHALGKCDGRQPWLGPMVRDADCPEFNRLLIRTASNSYFPQLLSVISLPEKDDELISAVDHVWTFLQHVQDAAALESVRNIFPPVKGALEGFANDKVIEEIKRRKGERSASAKSVKQAEIETLGAAKDEVGEDKPDGPYYARALLKEKWSPPGQALWMKDIERVVLVHRLREVLALAGFTRFEAASPDVTGELDIDVKRAPLASEITWLPAIENKGEGVFIQFNTQAVDTWCAKPKVHDREQSLKDGFDAWLKEHPGSKRTFPGIRYVMLHSFAHSLITAVSLECGYPASSIRERVYALPDAGYGVLIFTGTSDAEGTLGGLIEVGRRIHLHVRSALQSGELCSNDPVCAEHEPRAEHERRFLHGAACHGCLLIAETSCEQHNDFLDRSLVVPTVENSGVEFFSVDGLG